MKTEMKANRMELNMDELEQVNGGIYVHPGGRAARRL